jgi:hypothetical protein
MADHQPRHKLDLPHKCPMIPEQVSVDNLVAIVTLHHPKALLANQDTMYHKARIMNRCLSSGVEKEIGCHIYLHHTAGQPTFAFGRPNQASSPTHTFALDVNLPTIGAGKEQFTLVPARDAKCWRVESVSDTTTTVNGVPLQKYKTATKKEKSDKPHALYLDESRFNHVHVRGMKIDIWIITEAALFLELEPHFEAEALPQNVQNVEGNAESWAQNRWILSLRAEKCSTESYRVLQRFTGRMDTAKVFLHYGARDRRDREMIMSFKEKVGYFFVPLSSRCSANMVASATTLL